MIKKNCKQCSKSFVVEDDDLEFYKKISPTFAGKTFDIPTPTLCPICRDIRRSAFRNERNLYKRKCDKTGDEIVAMYPPDNKEYKIYKTSEWWKDDWDAMEYGIDFDKSLSFFEQFEKLFKKVPRISLFNKNTENCEYANYIEGCKNCYMTSVCYYGSENSHYCNKIFASKDNCDLSLCVNVEKSYEDVYCLNCYNCRYSTRLIECRDCYFCQDLTGCSDCLFCSGLIRKKYCVKNQQYSKEEYEKILQKYNFGSRNKVEEYRQDFNAFKKSRPVKFAFRIRCENCTGDNLVDCKDVKNGFNCQKVEDSKYCEGTNAKNVYDNRGGSSEWALECNQVDFGSYFIGCCSVLNCSYMYYCDSCHGCNNCFGCAGLRNKQYCILNKQYTKEEYGKRVSQIIEKMVKDGEWGEFFPISMSPFAYNASTGNEYYPLLKKDAHKFGAKWQDREYSLKYDGVYCDPKDDIEEYTKSSEMRKKLLDGVIKCEVSNKPFKIMPQELAFYLENKIPIPTKHYDVRNDDRKKLCNQREFYHRQCRCEEKSHDHPSFAEATEGKRGCCPNEFETTYALDRPEKVFCEKCYQGIIK